MALRISPSLSARASSILTEEGCQRLLPPVVRARMASNQALMTRRTSYQTRSRRVRFPPRLHTPFFFDPGHKPAALVRFTLNLSRRRW